MDYQIYPSMKFKLDGVKENESKSIMTALIMVRKISEQNAKQALREPKGDTKRGTHTWNLAKKIFYSPKKIRIFSGLYGLSNH